ncbi:MAG: acetylglutamate kinase [Actinomycetales bacterium]|nr:acetylglutamate kinase [Actinomycetales bacterium]
MSPQTARQHAAEKANVLAEAMPWLLRFRGATVVVKYGGHAMVDEGLQRDFARDITFMRLAGLRPVVVHGGGPQITDMLNRLHIPSEFVRGYRVTSPEALDVVRMVLTGQVQRHLVAHINSHGPFAVGVSGEDAGLFSATRATVDVDGEQVDVGAVGTIASVDCSLIESLLDGGMIPVVSSLARGEHGQTFNINADEAASALAVALAAAKLVVLTDVEGLYAEWPDPESVIAQIAVSDLERMLPDLEHGMVPKAAACVDAVLGGVPQAHIIDGRLSHALLLEVFTDSGVGTMVLPDADARGGWVAAAEIAGAGA